jgi:hypothetical protein
VAGAQKSGTTALRAFLATHPQIGLSCKGETHFFDLDPAQRLAAESEKTTDQYASYHAHYTPEALRLMTGDVTPVYIYLRPVLQRIKAYNPSMKIIVLLRDPAARAYSQWVMQSERGQDRDSFMVTILKEPFRYLLRGQDNVFSHIQRGFYAHQIERLFRTFPRENCLVLRHEELRDDHQGTLGRVYQFLGVDDILPPPQKEVHKRSYEPMSRTAFIMLRIIFRRDVARLEKLLGWDCAAWKSFKPPK